MLIRRPHGFAAEARTEPRLLAARGHALDGGVEEVGDEHGWWPACLGDGEYFFGGHGGEVDGGDGEVGVAELALQDVDGDAFSDQFDGMAVAELVWCESPAHAGGLSELSQGATHRRG